MRMTHETLLNEFWTATLERLGGDAAIAAAARETRAFLRPRQIKTAVDLLRIILAYCLGGMGLRSTSAWAASVGLANLSNVALLGRLRNCQAWMEGLVGTLLAERTGAATQGRRIRLVDATTVPKASRKDQQNGALWRIHAAFDLPSERFSVFELTDEKEAESLSRFAVTRGDILIADRGYCKTERMAEIAGAGADLIVRAGWKMVRWLDADGGQLDLIATLKEAEGKGPIDRPVMLGRHKSKALAIRLIAFRKPPHEIAKAHQKVRRRASKDGEKLAGATLIAAEWVILLTSLPAAEFPAAAIGELYRSRWRIEMAFKRLKSLAGLAGPPGVDASVAKTWILAHLLMILLLEPHTAVVEASPRSETSQARPRRAA